MKSNVTQIAKSLEKLFNAGFTDDKAIQTLQFEDVEKITGATMEDIHTIIKFKMAIRNKQIVKFLAGEEVKESEVQ